MTTATLHASTAQGRRVSAVRSELAVPLATGALAALLFLPFLGAPGLFDPWETHYAEVARQMLVRGDWVHPYWQNAYFFSKPPLIMWLMLPGLWASGAQQAGATMPAGVEWLVRAPFAALAVGGVAFLSFALARLTSRRVGLVFGAVLSTMSLYGLLARQAMTDMPFVVLVSAAVACAMLARRSERGRARWWLAAGVLLGLSTLAKGFVGVLLVAGTAAVALAWGAVELPAAARRAAIVAALAEVRVAAVACALVAAPWFLAMASFTGLDEERRTFVDRFFVYDHLQRLFSGVHTTTPDGTFTYFIEQLGYATFPWALLLPGALAAGASVPERWRPTWRVLAVWAALGFAGISLSATKFHHYVFIMLPPIAALMALFVDRVLEDGVRGRELPLALGALAAVLVGHDLGVRPRHWLDLFVYNQARPYPEALAQGVQPGLTALLAVTLLGAAGLLVLRRRGAAFGLTLVAALAGSAWLGWVHWPAMGAAWTQRELFARYFSLRAPGEPIAAFLMNWKGETFYSRNEVVQLLPGATPQALGEATQLFVNRLGRKWVLVEHPRLEVLRQAVGPGHAFAPVDPGLNHKFVLVRID